MKHLILICNLVRSNYEGYNYCHVKTKTYQIQTGSIKSINVIVRNVPEDTFWAEAMYCASAVYRKDHSFTHVLWLNEDVSLHPKSVDDLFILMNSYRADIVVGQTSSDDGEISYGGFLRDSRFKPLHFRRIIASYEPTNADTFNGNIVLLGPNALRRTGAFLRGYKHYLADIAYGLNASGKGLRVIVAPGFSGICQPNVSVNPSLDISFSRRERLKTLNKPKGIPVWQQLKFSLRYGGVIGILYFVFTYLRFLAILCIRQVPRPRMNINRRPTDF